MEYRAYVYAYFLQEQDGNDTALGPLDIVALLYDIGDGRLSPGDELLLVQQGGLTGVTYLGASGDALVVASGADRIVLTNTTLPPNTPFRTRPCLT